MRRILITPQIDALAAEYADRLNQHKGSYKNPYDNLRDLCNSIPAKYAKHRQYVNEIMGIYPDVLTLHPKDFDRQSDQLNKWQSVDDYHKAMKMVIQELGKMKFYELIVDAMRYDYAQEILMPDYVDKLQIKACVYCNAQYAITTDKLKTTHKDGHVTYGRRYAHYEFDHFKPKSLYPFLCTSFYNLLPSCGCCNKHKSDDESLFCLYTDDPKDVDVMQFMVDPNSVLQYYKDFDEKGLTVLLNPLNGNKSLVENHQQRFHIDEVYAHHKDVAFEAICHHLLHNSSYMQHLQDAYSSIFSQPTCPDADILFWGHHLNPDDTHKRPLNKLVTDISKTL